MSGIREETASDDSASLGANCRKGDVMKIGIIGAGKVGVTLGKYLADSGISLTGFYSRTLESAASAARFTDTKEYEHLEALVSASDTLLITTPDGEIGNVWDCIAEYGLKDKIVCHFSGSLSSEVFSGIDSTGASGCSIHPMYAFSDKFKSYQQFHTAYLTIEGQEKARNMMEKLFSGLGHRVLAIQAKDKVKYHAAAALISNDMIALLQLGLNLLSECGFREEDSMGLLRPIIQDNVSSMLAKGPVNALTGPVERGDRQTVEKHLKALSGSDGEMVYKSLGQILVQVAERKHPDRNYTALKKLFSLSEGSDRTEKQEEPDC